LSRTFEPNYESREVEENAGKLEKLQMSKKPPPVSSHVQMSFTCKQENKRALERHTTSFFKNMSRDRSSNRPR